MNAGNIAQRNVLTILLLQDSADIACEVERIAWQSGLADIKASMFEAVYPHYA
jgi:hypothetical protein